MKKIPLALAITTLVAFAPAMADTVNPANVTTFQGGTPAIASQVNSTFQALITAINDNAARIAAMETAQASLIPGDITGNTYCFFTLGGSVGASDPDPNNFGNGNWVGVSTGAAAGKLTITSPTQATFDLTSDQFREVLSPTYQMFDSSEAPGSELVTWTLVNNILTVTYADGGQDLMVVSPDGNMVVFNYSELERSSDNSGNWFSTELIIGVRALSCN